MDKWEIQEKIKDKWYVRGFAAMCAISFLSGFFLGEIAHYMIPINGIIVFAFCFMMYKSELADKLLYSYEKRPKAKKKR